MYQLTNTSSILRKSDGAFIPADLANSDYLDYLDWVAKGNTPEPYAPPALTPEQQLAEAKAQRATLVDAITVTTASGKVFDGNEDAQRRMTTAITAMDDTDTIPWVLHDNTVAMVGKAELREALRLSGAAMTTIWITPYTPQP